MISANELYYLNGALDGEKIYGINPIQNLIQSVEDDRSPAETLMEKNILEDDQTLNEKSYLIIDHLEQYKEAEYYVRINNALLSMNKGKESIYLEKDENGEYILKKVVKPLIVYSLIKNYSFLCGDIPVENYKEKVKMEDLIVDEILTKEKNEWFYIKKENDEEAYVHNIYYTNKEKVYKYNALTEELITINPLDIRNELLEIFEVEVNK